MPQAFAKTLCSLLLITAFACTSDDALTPAVDPYAFVQPPHFPEPTYDLENEPITKAGFELGKKLFSELRLSRTNDVARSCGATQ